MADLSATGHADGAAIGVQPLVVSAMGPCLRRGDDSQYRPGGVQPGATDRSIITGDTPPSGLRPATSPYRGGIYGWPQNPFFSVTNHWRGAPTMKLGLSKSLPFTWTLFVFTVEIYFLSVKLVTLASIETLLRRPAPLKR